MEEKYVAFKKIYICIYIYKRHKNHEKSNVSNEGKIIKKHDEWKEKKN